MMINLLLVTGACFLFGGIKRSEQYYDKSIAQTISMLLLLAALSVVVPTASKLANNTNELNVIKQSRGTAVIIITPYPLWLLFQMKTNRKMFEGPFKPGILRGSSKDIAYGSAIRQLASGGIVSAASAGGCVNAQKLPTERQEEEGEGEEEEEREPLLTLAVGIILLVLSTVLIGFNGEFVASSIQGLLSHSHVSERFLGLVVLPLLNADPYPIASAVKDKLPISISLTLERCMQIALLVIPLTVLLAWILRIDNMTLDFDGFSVVALFTSIIIVSYVVQEGKSNWLTSALLIKVYLIVALAAYYTY